MAGFQNTNGTWLALGAAALLTALGTVSGSADRRSSTDAIAEKWLRDQLDAEDLALIAMAKTHLFYGASAVADNEGWPGWESAIRQIREILRGLPPEVQVEDWSGSVLSEDDAYRDEYIDITSVDTRRVLLGADLANHV